MDQRFNLTEYVLKQRGFDTDQKSVKKMFPFYWVNPRKKSSGGFRLTQEGFLAFVTANIKHYQVDFPEKLSMLDNKLVIQLDRYIDCPFYITDYSIFVFGERTAVQLMLFSGNLKKFGSSQEKIISKRQHQPI